MISISIQHLKKNFDKPVLRDINLTIQKNCIYGLTGENGAGKTTLINCMIGLILPTSGEILMGNKNIRDHKTEIRKSLGVVLNEDYLINEFSGMQYLEFMGILYNLKLNKLKPRINNIVNFFFGDASILKKEVGSFSTGMKKKLALCASVLHTPPLLILDEPFSGLDPASCYMLIRFLKFYLKRDRTIFISSHNLHYLKLVATHLGIIQDGILISDGSPIKNLMNGKWQDQESPSIKIMEKDHYKFELISWILN